MRSLVLHALVSGLLFFCSEAWASDEAHDYREVTVHVVNQFHQPVAGIEVQLRGLDRGSINATFDLFNNDGPPRLENAKYQGWKFKTDAQGNCSARFGKFDYWEHAKAAGIASPGYGHFFLIVKSEGFAGGVSPEIFNLNDEERKNYKAPEIRNSSPEEEDAWKFGEFEPRVLTDEPKEAAPVEIVLKPGIEVSGQLIDGKEKPIRGETITLWSDLHADTHTGRGGEIFSQSVETDLSGRFHFHHVYPNLFYVSLAGQDDDLLIWIRTRVRNRWIEGIADAIWPHKDDVDLPLVIVATRDSPYHYFGKVTDDKGSPIRGATVRIQAAIHGPGGRSDFGDGHSHYSQAVTRADGSYTVPAAGPYVNWFEVTAPGFQTQRYSEDGEIYDWNRYEEVPCAPGRYNFDLKR